MAKSIQIKIVMIFMIFGIIIITGLGLIFISMLNHVNEVIPYLPKENLQELLLNQIYQVREIIYISLFFFTLMVTAVGVFMAKVIISPILRLIKSAEMITKGEDIDIEYLSTSKKQIEAILLHMTDGVVAFDMKGSIIHINLSAKKLLNISEEDNFDSIFKKYDVDINLEKIIYLENWTSSEKKLNIDNKSINLFFAPFKNENDKPAGMIVVIQDVTEQERLDNVRKQFVADVSHELKTPITSIMGYADTLIDGNVDEEYQKKFIDII